MEGSSQETERQLLRIDGVFQEINKELEEISEILTKLQTSSAEIRAGQAPFLEHFSCLLNSEGERPKAGEGTGAARERSAASAAEDAASGADAESSVATVDQSWIQVEERIQKIRKRARLSTGEGHLEAESTSEDVLCRQGDGSLSSSEILRRDRSLEENCGDGSSNASDNSALVPFHKENLPSFLKGEESVEIVYVLIREKGPLGRREILEAVPFFQSERVDIVLEFLHHRRLVNKKRDKYFV